MGCAGSHRAPNTPLTASEGSPVKTLHGSGLQRRGLGGPFWEPPRDDSSFRGPRCLIRQVLPTSRLPPRWGAVERPGPQASVGSAEEPRSFPPHLAPGLLLVQGSRPSDLLRVVGGQQGLTLRPLGLRTHDGALVKTMLSMPSTAGGCRGGGGVGDRVILPTQPQVSKMVKLLDALPPVLGHGGQVMPTGA